jgi:poly-gamma-glutamate synthesis protein (capsule biosynthesis protein)
MRLWLSPWLPAALVDPLQAMVQADAGLEITEAESEADVRIEPEADIPLTSWIFVAASPFPTVSDAIGMNDLAEAWTEGTGSGGHLYLSERTAHSLVAGLGWPGANPASLVPEDALLETAWSERPSVVLLPFEQLESRWKVLEIDGLSPIRKDFDVSHYPLVVTYGVSGKPWAVADIQSRMPWPQSNRDPAKMTTLVMTGVTALTRGTAWLMDEEGVTYPAEAIGDWLREADLTHVSNEVSFTDDCPDPDPFQASTRFCSQPEHFALLDDIGVDLVELTGNHLVDYGTQPLLDTLAYFRERNWWVFGGGEDLERASEPALVEHNGNRLAFIGCNVVGPYYDWATSSSPGATPCDKELLFAEVQRLSEEGYRTVFTYQWAESNSINPLPNQVESFRQAIDAGAVIVSGSQAHRPQTLEFYDDGFIHYGLGNLFFDQIWSEPTRQGVIDRHIFYAGRHIATEFLTTYLADYAQPRPMTVEERAAFLGEIFAAGGW